MRRETITSKSFSSERGAGTVLALTCISVALVGLAWVGMAGRTATKQLEAQALADRIALAADDALRGKTSDVPCDLAKKLSAENWAELDTCRIVESKVFIELHIYIDFSFSLKAVTLSLQASAAAGPVGS